MYLFSTARTVAAALCAALAPCAAADDSHEDAAALQTPPRPALVVIISVDQFPYEFLDRYAAGLDPNGAFRRLRDHGADFANCRYEHANTVTASGHAVISTGAYPNLTGIVENEWFDRAQGKVIAGIDDPDCKVVGTQTSDGEAGASPRKLLVPTIGDQLKLATNRKGRVFSIAYKDRAAILMAGFAADGAFWFHGRTARWITSTYYMNGLPDYLKKINDADLTAAVAGKTWDLLLPRETYIDYYPDDSPFEAALPQLGKSFPHKIPTEPRHARAAILVSPHCNELTLSAAQAIVENENLGLDEVPDLLCVGLSGTDAIGHMFGPYSLEIQDAFWRMDRQIAAFFDFLDRHVVTRPWVVFLTSDHGVAPIPEHAAELKLRAGRKPLGKLDDFATKLDDRLAAVLGDPTAPGEPAAATSNPAARGGPPAQQRYVLNIGDTDVYLNRDLPQLAGDRYLTAQRLVRDALLEQPGVAVAFTRETLLNDSGANSLLHSFALTYHPKRSGDVCFMLEPNFLPSAGNRASHGTPWTCDQHVPLFVMASKTLRPATRADMIGSFRLVSPTAIAPTIARMLRIEPPAAAFAEPLHELLP